MKVLPYLLLILLPFVSKAHITDWCKIKTDKSGNVYMLGEYEGKISIGPYVFGDSLLHSGYTSRYFIAKFDPSGTVLWADSLVGAEAGCWGNCPGYIGLAVDNDNNIVISLSSLDSTIYKGISYYQSNIIKLDSQGNLLWTKRIRERDGAETDVAVDSKNNIYYASVFGNSVISDSLSLISCDSTSQKTFVAKILPNGSTKWMREIASSIAGHTFGEQECFFIVVDSAGNSFVGGRAKKTISLGSDTFNCSSYYPFLAKLDSNGNPRLLKGYLNKWIDDLWASNLSDACVSKDQKLYITGSFRDTVYVRPSDIVVTKPRIVTPYLSHTNTSDGNAMWYQYNQLLITPPYSDTYWNGLHSVSCDDNNNLLVVGDIQDSINFFNGSGFSTLLPGPSKTYFAKFDSSGNFQCYKTDPAKLVAGTSFGSSYYTVGLTTEIVHSSFADIQYTSVQLMKWDISTCSLVWRDSLNGSEVLPIRVVNIAPENFDFSLFPNPNTTGVFMKKVNKSLNYSIEVFNSIGQKVEFIDNTNFIDLSKLPRGVYLYRAIFSDQSVRSGRIVYQ